VVTELKNRGVQDIFIACVDGLKGFPEAIETVYYLLCDDQAIGTTSAAGARSMARLPCAYRLRQPVRQDNCSGVFFANARVAGRYQDAVALELRFENVH
jgi:hypothetical protein